MCVCLYLHIFCDGLTLPLTSYLSHYAAPTDNYAATTDDISRDNGLKRLILLWFVSYPAEHPTETIWSLFLLLKSVLTCNTMMTSCMIHGKDRKHPFEWIYSFHTMFNPKALCHGKMLLAEYLIFRSSPAVPKGKGGKNGIFDMNHKVVIQTHNLFIWLTRYLMPDNISLPPPTVAFCINYSAYFYIPAQ